MYYDSARKFNDALWNDPKEVPSKPAKPAKATPSTTQTKPANQTTASTQSSVADHEVEANKVPNAYPVTIQGELKYQKIILKLLLMLICLKKTSKLKKMETSSNILLK